MRGRGQATLVVATTAVLSALVPPVSWLSSGALALVSLRRGSREGLLVLALALVGAGVLAFLSLGTPLPALSFALVLWLPILIIAMVLRATVDLGAAFAACGAIGLVAVAAVHLLLGDPGPWWAATLGPLIEPALKGVAPGRPVSTTRVASGASSTRCGCRGWSRRRRLRCSSRCWPWARRPG